MAQKLQKYFQKYFFIQVSINNYLNYTVQHTEIIRVESLRGCVGPGAKPPRGPPMRS